LFYCITTTTIMGLSQVLAALEVERFRKAALTAAQLNGDTTAGGDIAQTTAATLDTLMTLDTAAGGETQSTSKRSAKVLISSSIPHFLWLLLLI